MITVDLPDWELFRRAVERSDAEALRRDLERRPGLRRFLDEPLFSFGKPAVVQAAAGGDAASVEVLVDFGAELDRLSGWEPGGFGVLHSTCFDHPETAARLVEMGATVDVHAAAGLGRLDLLEERLDAEPELVHRRGPDGQLPLHFAADVATADFLIERGAELDARCLDHRSTAAQWAIGRAPDVARHLVARGGPTDVFLAVALGDRDAAGALIDADPECLRARLGRPGYDPVPPGSILQWSLGPWAQGGRASPHRVARAKGDRALYDLLMERSPADVRLLVHAWHGEEDAVRELIDARPGLVSGLGPEERRFLADAAWAGHTDAVRILLRAGFDPHALGDERSTPLDRAAFHGFADAIALLLEHDPAPPVHERNAFGGTPLDTLIYGSRHSWRQDGDFGRAARLLAEAGSVIQPHGPEQGPEAVGEALRPFVDRPAGRSRRHRLAESPVTDTRQGALEWRFDPNPTDVHEHERHPPENRPSEWIWYFRTELRNRSATNLRLVWMEAFYFENDRWHPGNGFGHAMGPDEIRQLFTEGLQPDGTLTAGGTAVRDPGWIIAYGPVRSPIKWAAVAVDENGVEHGAEALVDTVPYGVKA